MADSKREVWVVEYDGQPVGCALEAEGYRATGGFTVHRYIPAAAEQACAVPEVADVPRCPSCGSPEPRLHPAIQHEGECRICRDPYHGAPEAAEAGKAQAEEWRPVHDDDPEHPESGSAYWVIWEGEIQEVPWVWQGGSSWSQGWLTPGSDEPTSADHTDLCMRVALPSPPKGDR